MREQGNKKVEAKCGEAESPPEFGLVQHSKVLLV